MQENLDKLYGFAIQWGINLMTAILIFVIGKWAAKLAANFFDRVLLRAKVEKTLATLAGILFILRSLLLWPLPPLIKSGLRPILF